MKEGLLIAGLIFALASSAFACGDSEAPVAANPLGSVNRQIASLQEKLGEAKSDRERQSLSTKLKMAQNEKAKSIERLRLPHEKKIDAIQKKANKEIVKEKEALAQIDDWAGPEQIASPTPPQAIAGK